MLELPDIDSGVLLLKNESVDDTMLALFSRALRLNNPVRRLFDSSTEKGLAVLVDNV
jgi:hypothetical protein